MEPLGVLEGVHNSVFIHNGFVAAVTLPKLTQLDISLKIGGFKRGAQRGVKEGEEVRT